MQKQKYFIFKERNKYYFKNLKNNTLSKPFTNKVDAISIIMGYLNEKKISVKGGLDLLYNITELNDLPLCYKAEGIQLIIDAYHLELIVKTQRDLVETLSRIEGESNLPKLKKQDGSVSIIGKDFYSTSLFSKERAREVVDILFGNEKINRFERKKLLLQINRCFLPEKEVIPDLN